ncbi:MAG: hypothetical protein EHM58_05855 [Ignavibacteriae bacterium]|nr:MAG: hypothetical protein EHM58_05855 [Ignavibacteriota bacterium]
MNSYTLLKGKMSAIFIDNPYSPKRKNKFFMKYKYISIILYALLLTVFYGNYIPQEVNQTKQAGTKLATSEQFQIIQGQFYNSDDWETKIDYNISGSLNAVKGGSFSMYIADYPPTLRIIGLYSYNAFSIVGEKMMYESLLQLDPVTEDYIPCLATHWKISDDKLKYSFRINPEAKWADGKPVTAEDVIATWKLLVDPGIQDEYSNIVFSFFEQPVAEDKFTVSVSVSEPDFRLFLYFSTMKILPADYIGNLKGSDFLVKYDNVIVPGSGPYKILKEDINEGKSISLTRRDDYWGEKERFNIGMNNFDRVTIKAISDEEYAYELFKKGELDIYPVNRAQIWVEKLDYDAIKRGLILKRRIYNEFPNGVQGLVFNMRKEPFDNIMLRMAVTFLWNRERFNKEIFYNQYEMINSIYPGSVYENPDNPISKFDPDSAKVLLEMSGFTKKNSDGYLIKDGKIFEINMPYDNPAQERYLKIFQEDMKNAGIKLNLILIDPTAKFRLGNERNFDMLYVAWSGQQIPDPESSLRSETADEPNSTNWAGFKYMFIDNECDKYGSTFNKKDRVKILRRIDEIASTSFGYAFGWYAPYQRILFHNKFGYPEWIIGRTSNYNVIPQMWFFDKEKAEKYRQALDNKSMKLDAGDVDQKYWLEVKAKEELERDRK